MVGGAGGRTKKEGSGRGGEVGDEGREVVRGETSMPCVRVSCGKSTVRH